MPDHFLQLAAELRIAEHLQVSGEDGRTLVAQLLRDGPLFPEEAEYAADEEDLIEAVERGIARTVGGSAAAAENDGADPRAAAARR